MIVILGILAAVVLPQFSDNARDAREAGTRRDLATLREAIQRYRQSTGELPGQAGADAFKADIQPFITGPIPRSSVGNGNRDVRVTSTGNPLTASGPEDWAYDNVSGELIINHPDYSSW